MAHEETPAAEPPGLDRGSVREARREALLEAAAAEFNARGVSRASISRIAKAKGLTRAAVYYYVEDRDDLVFQAYRRSCQVMASDLAAARAAASAPLDQLTHFIRRALDVRRPPTAVLSELDYLKGEPRAAITQAHAANVEALRGLIRDGIAAGAFRSCDDEIIAQTLIGLLFWIPVSADWVADTESSYRARTVEALVDLALNGEAADPAFAFSPPISIRAFFPAAPDPFDRAGAAQAKLDHVLRIASQVFNRRGVDGASLDDVTAALGATKGVLYHYLENKTDLVVRCQERAADLYEQIAEAADRLGRTGLEKAMTGLYLLIQTQASGLSPLIQTAGGESLPPAARRSLRARNRGLQQRYEGFGDLGMADGSMRALDYAAVSQLGAGAFEWLPKWFDPTDPRAQGALAEEIVRFIAIGLRAR
jgi:AcrR family transcriptional regulator